MDRSESDAPYFAYGSNLHPARLADRVPSACLLTTASCPGRRLAWHKLGRDGSGKCDAPIVAAAPGLCGAESAATGPHGVGDLARIYGAVYRLSPADLSRLDIIEGCGSGYRRITLEVETDGGLLEVTTYVALRSHIDAALRPFHWYKQLVLEGARFHGFPAGYVQQIAATASITDPRPERATANLSVLDRRRR